MDGAEPTKLDQTTAEQEMIADAVAQLATARRDLHAAALVLGIEKQLLEQTPEWLNLQRAKATKARYEEQERQAYLMVAGLAVNAEERLGKHPHDAVALGTYTKFNYSQEAAMEWCKVNSPACIIVTEELNVRAFEAMVDELLEDDGVTVAPSLKGIVYVTKYPKAIISRDLTAFVPRDNHVNTEMLDKD